MYLVGQGGLWDGKDSGTEMYLVGQGNPKDIPKSQGDFGMGRTVGLWCIWWDSGVLRTSHSPKETLGL